MLDSDTICCRHDNLIELLRSFPSSTKLSLQFPPGALHSSTSGVVPIDPFSRRPAVDILVFLSMEVRFLCVEEQDRISLLNRMHVHQPSRCCCVARGVESFLSGSSCLNSLATNLHLHLSPFGTFAQLVAITFLSLGNSSHTSRFRMIPSRQALSSCLPRWLRRFPRCLLLCSHQS